MNLERLPTNVVSYSRALRLWAVLTSAATFALVAVGAVVTSFRVGMADPLWPTEPWYLLVANYTEPEPGYLIEHAHRAAGFLVGIGILVLTWWLLRTTPSRLRVELGQAAVLLLCGATIFGMLSVNREARTVDFVKLRAGLFGVAGALVTLTALVGIDLASKAPGRWTRAVAVLSLVGVILQGMFGGLRVYLHELQGTNLAMAHGVFAEVVFALTVVLAAMTSAGWNRWPNPAADLPLPARRLALLTAGVVFGQVVFGVVLRHTFAPLGQRLHLLGAFAVVGAVWAVVAAVRRAENVDRGLRRTAWLLAALVGVQILLGVEAWLASAKVNLLFQPILAGDAAVRTLHMVAGAGVFAASAALAARAWKAKLL